jgi:hypothetical protein
MYHVIINDNEGKEILNKDVINVFMFAKVEEFAKGSPQEKEGMLGGAVQAIHGEFTIDDFATISHVVECVAARSYAENMMKSMGLPQEFIDHMSKIAMLDMGGRPYVPNKNNKPRE